MSSRILYYVQHLMGVGHVFRAMRIAGALVRAGYAVDLVYGGEPIPNFDPAGARVHHLPPVRAGTVIFNDLVDPDGNAVTEDYKTRRRTMLLSVFEQGRHDAIMTEAFPFGRRQMRFELMPLLETAKRRDNRPVVIASVRDILQENRKPGRDEETVRTLREFFDHVLVHGDPALVTLEETFPLYRDVADMVRYTGIVAPPAPDQRASKRSEFDVIVSAGGGALGRELLFAAAQAKPLSCLADARWCIVSGVNFSNDDRAYLEQLAGEGVALRTFLPDLCAALTGAKLSISRCGYNTAADLFRSGCRSIVVPLSDGTETEQLRRAAILQAKGLAVRVDPAEQTPQALASAIDRAMALPPPDPGLIDLSGAETTARITTEILASR